MEEQVAVLPSGKHDLESIIGSRVPRRHRHLVQILSKGYQRLRTQIWSIRGFVWDFSSEGHLRTHHQPQQMVTGFATDHDPYHCLPS
ncbi:hypothetical protein R1flu_009596 [Riccia fluitans]|uniref:Uncharacterized protein n=1 Tax=Riccia fluitans TaxID=41844 RepID=A0ABD1Z3N1_9MARC